MLCSVSLSSTLYQKTENPAAPVFIPICAGRRVGMWIYMRKATFLTFVIIVCFYTGFILSSKNERTALKYIKKYLNSIKRIDDIENIIYIEEEFGKDPSFSLCCILKKESIDSLSDSELIEDGWEKANGLPERIDSILYNTFPQNDLYVQIKDNENGLIWRKELEDAYISIAILDINNLSISIIYYT